MGPSLSLIVLRAIEIERCVAFYEAIGCEFDRHSHGKGPEHYACELGQAVFEIYPLTAGKNPTTTTRLGFQVVDIDSAVKRLEQAGGKVIQPPADSEWGQRAVLDDPEGHRVEITAA